MQKALFITYNEALHTQVIEQIELALLRGYTNFGQVVGVGSKDGEPHLGSHAWPTMNTATIVIADQEKATELKKRLELLDADNPALGLRVFTWTVDE